MAQLLIRNLEDPTKAKLKNLARQHGVSMEEEARNILRCALTQATTPQKLGQQIHQIFASIDLGSADLVKELHGFPVYPINFE